MLDGGPSAPHPLQPALAMRNRQQHAQTTAGLSAPCSILLVANARTPLTHSNSQRHDSQMHRAFLRSIPDTFVSPYPCLTIDGTGLFMICGRNGLASPTPSA